MGSHAVFQTSCKLANAWVHVLWQISKSFNKLVCSRRINYGVWKLYAKINAVLSTHVKISHLVNKLCSQQACQQVVRFCVCTRCPLWEYSNDPIELYFGIYLSSFTGLFGLVLWKRRKVSNDSNDMFELIKRLQASFDSLCGRGGGRGGGAGGTLGGVWVGVTPHLLWNMSQKSVPKLVWDEKSRSS